MHTAVLKIYKEYPLFLIKYYLFFITPNQCPFAAK